MGYDKASSELLKYGHGAVLLYVDKLEDDERLAVASKYVRRSIKKILDKFMPEQVYGLFPLIVELTDLSDESDKKHREGGIREIASSTTRYVDISRKHGDEQEVRPYLCGVVKLNKDKLNTLNSIEPLGYGVASFTKQVIISLILTKMDKAARMISEWAPEDSKELDLEVAPKVLVSACGANITEKVLMDILSDNVETLLKYLSDVLNSIVCVFTSFMSSAKKGMYLGRIGESNLPGGYKVGNEEASDKKRSEDAYMNQIMSYGMKLGSWKDMDIAYVGEDGESWDGAEHDDYDGYGYDGCGEHDEQVPVYDTYDGYEEEVNDGIGYDDCTGECSICERQDDCICFGCEYLKIVPGKCETCYKYGDDNDDEEEEEHNYDEVLEDENGAAEQKERCRDADEGDSGSDAGDDGTDGSSSEDRYFFTEDIELHVLDSIGLIAGIMDRMTKADRRQIYNEFMDGVCQEIENGPGKEMKLLAKILRSIYNVTPNSSRMSLNLVSNSELNYMDYVALRSATTDIVAEIERHGREE